jgi:hypothetical protein
MREVIAMRSFIRRPWSREGKSRRGHCLMAQRQRGQFGIDSGAARTGLLLKYLPLACFRK